MSEITHNSKKLILFIGVLGTSLLSASPALAAFNVTETRIENSAVIENKPAKTTIEVSSNADMSNVTVQVAIVDASRRAVEKKEFVRQKFVSGKSNSYDALFATKDLPAGDYSVAVDIYGADMTTTYFFKDGLSPFQIAARKNSAQPNVAIVDTKINPAAGTFGENAIVDVQLKSATDLEGVTVEICLHDSSKRVVAKREFPSQAFMANQILKFTATFATISLKPGRHSVSARVLHGGEKKPYLSKEKIAGFRIERPAAIKTTGMDAD
jgi:methionine-rich copper-binding protein CopC